MNKLLFSESIFGKKSRNLFKTGKSKVVALVLDLHPQATPHTSQISQKHLVNTAIVCAVLVLIAFTFFTIKAFDLQITKGQEYAALADHNKTKNFSIPAERGVIYDANGTVLVRNKPAFSLVMDTRACFFDDIQKCKDTIRKVNSYVEFDIVKVFEELDKSRQNIILAEGLTKDEIISIEPKVASIPNIEVITSPVRTYLFRDAFAHVLGYVGMSDSVVPRIEGKVGIEQAYDTVLAGSPGRKIVQTDATGSNISDSYQIEPTPGENVYLYLDAQLQNRAFELLKQSVEDGTAVAGSIVAQDPKTGGILALANYPSFDPEKLSYKITTSEFTELITDTSYPFFNRAISAVYPPGSTFKMVTASAALSEGVITPSHQIFDPGYLQVGAYTFRNWKLDGHGDVDIFKALQVSNDTYFYTVGGGYGNIKGLGINKLANWARKFGYGDTTGIDILGEASGYVPDGTTRAWYLGDTYITSIGQGDLLATPLQVNNVTALFANGGHLLRPKVLKRVEGANESGISVIREILLDREVFEVVRTGMNLAVEEGGTGYPVFDFPKKYGIKLAGKTGTSEYIKPDGTEGTHAWFTVFGPYEDATIALTVFLEGGGSGSDDAAPIARELLEYWFTRED